MKIGIFDSGLGGLTALAEAEILYPSHDIIYFGDTGRVPYGGRSKETLLSYASQDVRFLLSRGAEIILIACGTVSSNCLPELQKKFDLPITGVVEAAARKACEISKNRKIAVIGTQATVNSRAFEDKIKSFLPDAQTLSVACPLFTPLVENGFAPDDPVTVEIAKRYLAPIKESGADTLILGCTHYPIIASCISSVLPGVTLISSGKAGAEALGSLLKEDGSGKGKKEFYVSDTPQDFAQIASVFLSEDISGKVEKVDITVY